MGGASRFAIVDENGQVVNQGPTASSVASPAGSALPIAAAVPMDLIAVTRKLKDEEKIQVEFENNDSKVAIPIAKRQNETPYGQAEPAKGKLILKTDLFQICKI